jgi:hypothetical protein
MESRAYRCWSRNHLGTLGICRCCAEAPDELGSGGSLEEPSGGCRSRLPNFGVARDPEGCVVSAFACWREACINQLGR